MKYLLKEFQFVMGLDILQSMPYICRHAPISIDALIR